MKPDFSQSSTQNIIDLLSQDYALFYLPYGDPEQRKHCTEFRLACLEELKKRFEQEYQESK